MNLLFLLLLTRYALENPVSYTIKHTTSTRKKQGLLLGGAGDSEDTESLCRQRADTVRERRAGVAAPYRFPVNGIPPPPAGAPPFSKGGSGGALQPVSAPKAPLLKGAGTAQP